MNEEEFLLRFKKLSGIIENTMPVQCFIDCGDGIREPYFTADELQMRLKSFKDNYLEIDSFNSINGLIIVFKRGKNEKAEKAKV